MDHKLTHFDEEGKAVMVDVSEKSATKRTAIARGTVKMSPKTLELIEEGKMGKGDVLGVARVAGIMAAKKTWEMIPMCHPIMLTGCEVAFFIDQEKSQIIIEAMAKTTGKTGVEMEALTMVSAIGLTIYDMCKAVDKKMVIGDIHLVKKTGGKSGT
ncbi:cyclic pyranopterin monophosphate synthase MoaC [Crassaminicella profunda]|uniref:cyclic pyranopterin monophosphate synthase MoaC n=1 Tax=Crassaminicella profunda TaxID=1286698 RepID=UPI001CA5FE92|nr:cyclic pyranopterin monophosphate synthase MoaC [Crassaminicella profunda]QZY54042.1 cyclic pyranopterin monophosphate synthase MoaC [Crassaminicella profunda]